MGQRIKQFGDGSFLEYDRGKFDEWCVYLTRGNGAPYAPKDKDYFKQLQQYAREYGTKRIYGDYVKVYALVGKSVKREDLDYITSISQGYAKDAVEIDILYSTLYMAMIAEERKKNTYLGKRIKRLGIHVLLMEGKDVNYAADFMRRMGWREIDELCKVRGF